MTCFLHCVVFGNLSNLSLHLRVQSPSLVALFFYPFCINFLLSFVVQPQSEPFIQPHIYRPRNGPVSVPQPNLFPGGRSSSSSQEWQGTLALAGNGGGASRYIEFVTSIDLFLTFKRGNSKKVREPLLQTINSFFFTGIWQKYALEWHLENTYLYQSQKYTLLWYVNLQAVQLDTFGFIFVSIRIMLKYD